MERLRFRRARSFSGGEPTLSPHFLEACRYAREVGYWSVQAASNGLRFVLEPEFAFQAKEAGLNMVYLQFDGVTNEANRHRHIDNLYDAKCLAIIERLHEAGIDITPVTTVVRTVNDDQVGPILDFMIRNSDKIGAVSFQPVSFTGRDEDISDEERHRKRYTTSHLARDLSRYYDGKIDPYRDWYPFPFRSSRRPSLRRIQVECSSVPGAAAAKELRNRIHRATTSFHLSNDPGDLDTSPGRARSNSGGGSTPRERASAMCFQAEPKSPWRA